MHFLEHQAELKAIYMIFKYALSISKVIFFNLIDGLLIFIVL